jgi:chromate transporter
MRSASEFALVAGAFLLLFMWSTPPWLVVILCAVSGAILASF